MGQAIAPNSSVAGSFAFAGVVLDADTRSLRIDGLPVQCSRKAFELLLRLCLAPDRVSTREELIGALWPGGQIASDEALTQIIFRARAVLGRHASTLLTVRGVGLRLGAPVTRSQRSDASLPPPSPGSLPTTPRRRADDIADDSARAGLPATIAPTAAPTPSPSCEPLPLSQAATAGPRSLRGPTRWPWLGVLVLVLALAAAGTGLRLVGTTGTSIDAGYGLYQADLHGSDPGSAAILREAFLDDARGDRGRGEALLQAVHAADASTPIPAAFLSLWAAGQGDRLRAAQWLELARARSAGLHDVYLNLLLGYIAAELDADGDAVLRQAGALLDLRPQAWRMHHARAHLMMVAGMRTAALRELQQIEVPALGHRKLEMVIADRASLGDIDGAQALLDRLPETKDAAHAFLRGRIAWSRGNFDVSERAYRQAADLGLASARLDLKRRALMYLAVILVMRHADDAAIADLERARHGLKEDTSPINAIDISLFLAELHARSGRTEAMDEELARATHAAMMTNTQNLRLTALLVAARLKPASDQPEPTSWTDAETTALWHARTALNRGDREAAALALTEAARRGIFDTRLVEEARFLAWQLGQAFPAERPLDPPFPPLSVAVLRRDLRDAAAGAEHRASNASSRRRSIVAGQPGEQAVEPGATHLGAAHEASTPPPSAVDR